MRHINALKSLATGEPVQVLAKATATALIASGHVRRASVDPEPKDGIAVNLTALGRGAVLAGGVEPEPEVGGDVDTGEGHSERDKAG